MYPKKLEITHSGGRCTKAISGNFCPKIALVMLTLLATILLAFSNFEILGFSVNFGPFIDIEYLNKIVAAKVEVSILIFRQNLTKIAIVR